MKNYRPITTIYVLAKMIEKLFHKRMMDFIHEFNVINSDQFGFFLDHNTSDALLEFFDNT